MKNLQSRTTEIFKVKKITYNIYTTTIPILWKSWMWKQKFGLWNRKILNIKVGRAGTTLDLNNEQ